MKRRFPCFIILAAGLAMTFLAWRTSYTYNEDGRLASGALYLGTGDFSSFHVNPPLVSLIGAIPATLGGAELPTRGELGLSSFGRDEYRAGPLFLEKNPENRFYLFSGRLCCIALVLFGLLQTFRFACAVLGRAAGYVFLLLCAFSPFILGFGSLIVPDVSSGVWGAVSVFLFWRWLRVPDNENAFLAGCALGFAELTKFTLLVFYPLFVILWLIYLLPVRRTRSEASAPRASFRRQLLQLALVFVVSLFVVNVGYGFEGTGKQLRTFRFQTTLFTGCKTLDEVPGAGGNRFGESGNAVERALGYLPTPLPKNFVQGIDTQRLDFEGGMPSYLRGEWSDRGWAHFYLYALLIKTPVGAILLFLLAIFCTFFLKGYNASWRDEAVLLLPGVVLLAFVSSQTGFSIHARYAISALPFFFLWTSKVGRAFTGLPQQEDNESSKSPAYPQGYKTVRVLTIALLAWSLLSGLSVYPHSISYFNELAALIPTPKTDEHPQIPPSPQPHNFTARCKAIISAGPRNGPRHLLDSNIDWGQDLFNLERRLQKRPEVDTIKVVYWGSCPVSQTTIPTSDFYSVKPEPGRYAISVNNIYSREGDLRYFLDYVPVDMVGYSIYIYVLTQEEIDAVEAKKQQRLTPPDE